MAQNEHVLRQWMMDREAQAQQQEYALNKSRQGLASNLNPGLLAGGGAPRHQQLQSRMQSLTGPMYPDGRQTQNDIRGGTGIRPNYPTPELRQHRGEVSQSNTPPRNIGAFMANAQPSLMRGSPPQQVDERVQMRKDEGFSATAYLDKTNTDAKTGRKRVLTIGYGFNMDQSGGEDTVRKSGITKNWADLRSGKASLTKEEAVSLQNVAHAGYEQSAMNFAGESSWNIMTPDQKNALTNVVSNLGSNKLNNSFPSMRREMRAGNFGMAARELMVDKGGVKPSAYALQVGDRATRLASRLAGQPAVQQHIGGGMSSPDMASQFGSAPQPMQMMNNRSITAPPEMYNPPDSTMTLTKPFPITNSTRQSQPNLGFAQKSGGTYGDAEMQRMVALSQQLQNQSVA